MADRAPLPECQPVRWFWIITELVKLQQTTAYDLTQAWEFVKAEDYDGAQTVVERLHLGMGSEEW